MHLKWLVAITTLLVSCAALSTRAAEDQGAAAPEKKVVFVSGTRSHGYGAHEHYAGNMLLAKCLEAGLPGIETVVYRDGWPKDPQAFDGADTIVMYCDGGGGHMVNSHLEQVDALAKKGVGIVCLHYAVEVPAGKSGNSLLDWIGGYFEMHWSVNPHWVAKFEKLPDHPIARGVEPFEMNDEWYYHMRFREGMQGVTPILSDVPPANTLSRPDGPHSGNPAVRAAVAKGEPQHVAWAYEQPDGRRGFGFTGGHFHWNWADPNFRTLVLNAIVWTAKGEVPEDGVPRTTVTLEELEANQDFEPPQNFDREQIRKQFNLPRAGENQPGKQSTGANSPQSSRPNSPRSTKPVVATKLITPKTPGHSELIDADISGANRLYLVVSDGGDSFACDWADWAEPRLVGPAGEKRLTELKWKSARSDWGQTQVNRNAGGGPLRIDGKSVEYGIGTHSNSMIAFDLPPGYTRFQARGGLDNGGTDQGSCGQSSSIQFFVYTEEPPAMVARVGGSSSPSSHDPADAVAGLDVADGLDATLFASEPTVRNLTNLDIDHRGRVWVCEVMNYRGRNGTRPEGDRILILEDTDGDGKADKSTVYYQGRDVDSAMGICVLGNKVIVSCSPNVLIFTDENGDDRPDKKELLFTNTGVPQHDHSAHTFLFGPDGKLYWNFGNYGHQVCDSRGKPVVDLAGNPVVDKGRPYFGGMAFRCNLDGSQFEVLAHNFRNNYELTVDSFGSLWQSDNDDDGNRGVRINYVMEYGNYGYQDEMTGAGWKTPRTNLEAEIPAQHWHLNDPGVVPNLLHTGAGSPSGITVYEGRLLPEVFWDQVIHCDPGPNVVRAYPVSDDGAGYQAEIVNVVSGARDNWFRPADVCVAPDGSLFVTDWYDPGVGGHNQQDSERGRLFRIAPPGSKYEVPQFDFDTAGGAVQALTNPNYAVRYLAWTALDKMGLRAEPTLLKMFETSDNPRHRARALWLLARLENRGLRHVQTALQDKDPNIRMVAIRAARERNFDIPALLATVVHDPSPQVRRECAVALRYQSTPPAALLWAELAAQHDAQDRWYLEALGIGADRQWDAFLAAWRAKVGERWNTPAGRDIVWRSRAAATPDYLTQIIADASISTDDLPRYFRAFDFLRGSAKDAALLELAFAFRSADPSRQQLISTESLQRVKGIDVAGQPAHAAALDRVLDRLQGTSQFLQLVGKFNVQNRYPQLIAMAQEDPAGQVGLEAISLLLAKNQTTLLRDVLTSSDAKAAANTAQALANSADGRAAGLLLPVVKDATRDLELRRQATRGAAMTRNGALELIRLAKAQQLDEALQSAAAFQLSSAPWEDVRSEAAKLFPTPPTKNNEPLPSISELLNSRGNARRGEQVFATTAECAKCHVVGQAGKDVGPNLSEIGSKLSQHALLESVLYPSAGISHNYETYALALGAGNVLTGILVSETDDSVTIKSADAIVRTLEKSDIEEMKKQTVSLMPADLQRTMTVQDLIDVVAYLATLKKVDN